MPDTVGKDAPEVSSRALHWVDTESAVDCDVNLYDRLFSVPDPGAGGVDFRQHLNPNSLVVIKHCKAEASLGDAVAGEHYQFEREGYFTRDSCSSDNLIFNCTIGLRDNWKA